MQLDSLGLRALLEILRNMVTLDLRLSLLCSERAPTLIKGADWGGLLLASEGSQPTMAFV